MQQNFVIKPIDQDRFILLCREAIRQSIWRFRTVCLWSSIALRILIQPLVFKKKGGGGLLFNFFFEGKPLCNLKTAFLQAIFQRMQNFGYRDLVAGLLKSLDYCYSLQKKKKKKI